MHQGWFGDDCQACNRRRWKRAWLSAFNRRTGKRAIAITLAAVLFALVVVPCASAVTERPLKEEFGSAEQPSFRGPSAVTVEQRTGDVLIGDSDAIRRFHADGKPAPFEKLGTNVIDGEANGQSCPNEPASCDETEQGTIKINFESQIAIDESGGPTDGDIYLSQSLPEPVVDIFADDGSYLGQLTGAGDRPFGSEPTGVAVDRSGALYVSIAFGNVIDKFVPTGDLVANDDIAANFSLPGETPYGLSMGAGPTAGSLFVASLHSEVLGGSSRQVYSALRLDQESGQITSRFADGQNSPSGLSIAVSPITGRVLISDTGAEYEFPTGAPPVRVGRVLLERFTYRRAVAFTHSNEVIAAGFAEGEARGAAYLYGEPATVPTVTAEPAREVTGTTASVEGTVDLAGGPEITECIFEYGKAYLDAFAGPVIEYKENEPEPCEGLNATEGGPVHATLSGLESDGQLYGFRLVAFNENGHEETEGLTFTTTATVATEPATGVTQTAATLNGTVRPEGNEYSECFFEYGLATATAFEHKAACTPSNATIGKDFQPHEVTARVTGLVSGLEYRYRLVATSSDSEVGTVEGGELRLVAAGLPRISEVRASGADESSVTLEAKIDPNGFGTTYRFEWGQTPAYGNLAPIEFAPFVGSGQEPVAVQARLSGLAVGGTYHYRVTATSSRGVVQSPDHVAETLDSCGLPQGRCFELVSRSEAGPVALPGEFNAYIELHYQAATSGSGALAYPVEGGYPEATKGAEVVYVARRGAAAWQSTQISPPIAAQNERSDGSSVTSATTFLSNDLSCGVTESTQPLTSDPSMLLAREEGASNLYRINPEGSPTAYTGITTLPPSTPVGEGVLPNYTVAGASQDCGVVLFYTNFEYPGVSRKLSNREEEEHLEHLYEWRNGTLRNAVIVPGRTGEVALPGAHPGGVNAVSEDGSRLFFTVARKTSPDPAEIGAQAIFVRENGRETRDLSLSQTATPDEGATYQWATPDGSKVFFLANAGLTAQSNREGTDLYEYDLEADTLTDRSVTGARGGAQVTGLVGADAGGAVVYFASPNQLVPGRGNTLARNNKARTLSIYAEKEGEISFVGTFDEADRDVVLATGNATVSQVSQDGRFLLFDSAADVTDYESHGLFQAYLYDAESQTVTCVSCRQDGQPSTNERYGNPFYQVLDPAFSGNRLHPTRFFTELDGVPEVFFSSPDPLAPGAIAGQNNIYEWAHDQLFRLVSAPAGTQTVPNGAKAVAFTGASDDGSDVYLVTPETLTWQDGDQRISLYDARVGGGYPPPPAAAAPCEARGEGGNACIGPPQATGEPTAPTSGADRGQQNAEPKAKKKPQKKKHKHKKHHKRNHKKKANSKEKRRGANGNRGSTK